MNGDVFFNLLSDQNITTQAAYMGSAGNHETHFNFSHYTYKFDAYNYIADPNGKPDQNCA